MNTVSIGDIGEAMAIADFTKAGFVVSAPLSNNARYDLIIDNGEKIYRVQVKTTESVKDEKMIFATKTTNYSKGNWKSTRYSINEVDIFYLYCLENDWRGLYIPENEILTQLNIRFTPPKSGQKVGIKMQEDFCFEKQIKFL